MIFSNDKIAELRDKVRGRLSAKRFAHVLAVEDCAAKLGAYMLPSRVDELRVAALLHDISRVCDPHTGDGEQKCTKAHCSLTQAGLEGGEFTSSPLVPTCSGRRKRRKAPASCLL